MDHRATISRRHAVASLLGMSCLRVPHLDAATTPPIRLAVSETLVSEVNLNDARAAMQIWLQQMERDFDLSIEFPPKIFDTTEEIFRRARTGQFDAVALNVAEYRQISEHLDPSQVIAETDGAEQYLLLAKAGGSVKSLPDLKGKRLLALKAPKMCVAAAWLNTVLKEARLGESETFFGSVVAEVKPSRVVLPVFFGQTDACLTSRRGFEVMCELNPQVAKELTVLASSPPMMVTFYTFHKNYHGVSRDRFTKVYAGIPASAAGRQLATLFQFQGLAVRDKSCLAPALAILDAAERIRPRPLGGSQ
jgi:ABC-type phosphate/phosphonate transport system substrate-binding protein